MKAWEVTTKYSDDEDIVFADTKNQAKVKLLEGNTLLDSDLANDDALDYIDIRSRRLKELDGWEDKSLLEIAEFLVLACDWTWDTGKHVWTADNFNKKEFKKEFLEHEGENK